MPRVLITGARAPCALELARSFAAQGWTVYTADSFHFTVCNLSRAVARHFHLPSPRYQFAAFAERMAQLVGSLGLELVVPTCEEVFYLSRLSQWLDPSLLYCDPLPKLRQLHSKWEFLSLAQGCPIGLPDSRLATSPSDLPSEPGPYVVKREFSRFGASMRLGSAAGIVPSPEQRWVVQERLRGQELCSYGAARAGRLTAWALYEPVYRMGRASSVYFRPIEDGQALDFARAFVEKLNFTGHLGFDFIRTAAGLFVLECNPRATSGIHLLAPGLALESRSPAEGLLPAQPGDRMLTAAMLLALPQAWAEGRLRSWLVDLARGRDVVKAAGDPWPALGLLPHLAEVVWRSLRGRLSLKDASTADIEWDGEPF